MIKRHVTHTEASWERRYPVNYLGLIALPHGGTFYISHKTSYWERSALLLSFTLSSVGRCESSFSPLPSLDFLLALAHPSSSHRHYWPFLKILLFLQTFHSQVIHSSASSSSSSTSISFLLVLPPASALHPLSPPPRPNPLSFSFFLHLFFYPASFTPFSSPSLAHSSVSINLVSLNLIDSITGWDRLNGSFPA